MFLIALPRASLNDDGLSAIQFWSRRITSQAYDSATWAGGHTSAISSQPLERVNLDAAEFNVQIPVRVDLF
jgi:hypothetical protein